MSDFKCEVVRVGKLLKHPNADTLMMTNIWAYPVLIKAGEVNEGDLAVYISIDSVCPKNDKFAFLGSHSRIKAKKLRGVFSMGLLLKADPTMQEGQDASGDWGIVKYEEPDETVSCEGNLKTGTDCETVPFFSIKYDIEPYRRYAVSLQENEEVVITEKLHGANSRFIYFDDRLWCGSHRTWKKEDPSSMWWKMAEKYNLKNKLKELPHLIFYGETYGWVQDLHYNHKQGEASLAIFDIYDLEQGIWQDWYKVTSHCFGLGLPVVPQLYRGPWNPSLLSFADGMSTAGDNIREGIVIKPVKERFDIYVGRPILKHVSEEYLLRKNGTERH